MPFRACARRWHIFESLLLVEGVDRKYKNRGKPASTLENEGGEPLKCQMGSKPDLRTQEGHPRKEAKPHPPPPHTPKVDTGTVVSCRQEGSPQRRLALCLSCPQWTSSK